MKIIIGLGCIPERKKGNQIQSWVTFALNPFTPTSDKHLNSPYKITPKSNIEVTRIKEMIINYQKVLNC